jgi:hypothetical protein
MPIGSQFRGPFACDSGTYVIKGAPERLFSDFGDLVRERTWKKWQKP